MAGYREFQTGEVLTAANVNDFLMQQSVMKFADATARDTALGTAVGGGNALREGMVAYLDDEDLPSFYNGTAWTTEFGGGGLVAVKTAYKTDVFSASLTSGNSAAITDLSITHALSDASNKVLMFGAVHGNSGRYFTLNAALAIDDVLYVGDADGDRIRTGSTSAQASTEAQAVTNLSAVFEPGDTSSHDYEAFIISTSPDTRTAYVNRSLDNSNSEQNARPVSWIVLMEVKV